MKDIGKLQGELAVAKAMQQADALLFPSRSEGHPLVGIEAMACGLPVIAMAQSSIIEMIKDGITGYLCEPDNTQDFANKIRILKENSELRRSMASNARTDALHRFSSVIMTQRYLECYDALI
ncbi:glycosyltransferase [Alcanivorax sp. IO_7]|nr:glycosyltransferase [Alcanivorax sp. IO_7]